MTRPSGQSAPLAHLQRGRDRGRSPERIARRGHAAKFSFITHLIVYFMTLLLIAITGGPFVALIVSLAWGIGLAVHGFFVLVAPVLRSRWEGKPVEAPPLAAAPARFDESRARSLEELSAAIAHEIRNPITAAKSLLQQIVEDPTSADTAKHSQIALHELDRVEHSIAHLLRYAREVSFNPTTVDVRDLIENSIDLFRDRAAREHVRFVREWEDLPIIQADGEQLRQVLSNLIGNALDALATSQTVDPMIELSGGLNLAGTEVWIRVRDNGPGVPADVANKLFRPFFTTKARGTGLGLSLSRKFVERHGGTIELTAAAGSGAAFVVSLPRTLPPGVGA
ncbi:MAG TPA: ATP-binding protein [Polyangiales bacterium]|nr:ATP-binding protein [Polyangiales bacterium]